ncbi:hypothetical protein BDZ89DRAFT_1049829 [Hymenopellis radicata]|nr:hypothetical protein BDZ89DRAFT_1049829 [Hymenopellis radicata]
MTAVGGAGTKLGGVRLERGRSPGFAFSHLAFTHTLPAPRPRQKELLDEYQARPFNHDRCRSIVRRALSQSHLSTDGDSEKEAGQDLLITRDLLEVGADCALIADDSELFTACINKLVLYYKLSLPVSERKPLLLLARSMRKLPEELLYNILIHVLDNLGPNALSALFGSTPHLFYSSLAQRRCKFNAYGIVDIWYAGVTTEAEKFLIFLKDCRKMYDAVLAGPPKYTLDQSYSPGRVTTLLISLSSFPPTADTAPMRHLRLTHLTVLFDWNMSANKIAGQLAKWQQEGTLQKLWLLAEWDESEHEQCDVWRARYSPFLTARCLALLDKFELLSSFAFSHPSPIIPMHDLWPGATDDSDSTHDSSEDESEDGSATDHSSNNSSDDESQDGSAPAYLSEEPRQLSPIHHEEEKRVVEAWAAHLPSLSHAYLAYCQSKVYNIADGAHTNAPENCDLEPMGALSGWTKGSRGEWARERRVNPSMGDMPFSQSPWYQDWFYQVSSGAAYNIDDVDVGLRYKME